MNFQITRASQSGSPKITINPEASAKDNESQLFQLLSPYAKKFKIGHEAMEQTEVEDASEQFQNTPEILNLLQILPRHIKTTAEGRTNISPILKLRRAMTLAKESIVNQFSSDLRGFIDSVSQGFMDKLNELKESYSPVSSSSSNAS